ncbi:DNA methyltransferase [Candidatus Thiodictyon syntrophicum]|jgi:putative DNA methylase|uniref:Adenine-specific DNA methylase n=1 Tax=Candidatus Thiodictyon syntrophicum TaxID=1166950 RepID=A0A2K8UFT6_9GAMM|nr:DNA methyltransferase [Candidatus Thiodictyon syntrophicum]AUB83981.1 adenine-specific DNA methylase [Candidatus Thiodictyon syntrophicum]
MNIHDVLKSRREQLGLSLRATAGRCGVDPAHLSRVESGSTPPSDALIERLADALAVPLDELLLVAGRVPPSLRRLVEKDPHQVAAALSDLAGMMVAEPGESYGGPVLGGPTQRAIEDGFPFEYLSDIAEVESWRKEVWRPVYHTHKWWAQRLGSVFRAVILGCATPRGTAVMDLYASAVKLPGPVIFDPFMGSGTTVGEAHKLGCTVIGRDINPVAWRAVRTALAPIDRTRLMALFAELEATIGPEIRALHTSRDSAGAPCEVLYLFWVKQLDCPDCGAAVDLFSSRVFAKHAYVKKFPTVQLVCPRCGDIFAADFTQTRATCPACRKGFDPHVGPAAGAQADCGGCGARFAIAKTARARGEPPRHRLYAKLVLRADGTKEYLQATPEDEDAYAAAGARLRELALPSPRVAIQTGYNTRQVLNYGYTRWDQFFNDRQLLGIGLLSRAIGDLPAGAERDALFVLLSGVLEFNNLFASYKGEGTGAVRHMFSHHVLKPERTPIEANLWGTSKSSGSFLNLFQSRLLRAVDYKAAPFELALDDTGGKKAGRKLFGKSRPMGVPVLDAWPEAGMAAGAVYLSCGDSAATDIPDRTVDAVVTDPPFYDNVHYSELADFFHVWQRLWFGETGHCAPDTTRHPGEVQDTESVRFAGKLQGVFAECHRVLKDEGLLVFSYHHSREDGWTSVAAAVLEAGFKLVQTQPVKAEMSVAMPKLAAKSPIDLDVLMVCRKAAADRRPLIAEEVAMESAAAAAGAKVRRFNGTGRRLSLNDVRIVVYSQALVELCAGRRSTDVVTAFEGSLNQCAAISQRLFAGQDEEPRSVPPRVAGLPVQASLF